ncbi:dynein axonemal assembly factor 1 homolog [Anopheles ziemanni]|uniref:dynein axonemal assembly factor 1 homolog n=1 Tax=Anopheles coustani TaxID=139045 RepID=UPI00265B5C6E|nr:dynein axonemal assembly factor 1 homolog [Anopheles coustani]XP_058177307.1 dynein axonemal assembly factor 1 homolog [Anopheles ziemanni]
MVREEVENDFGPKKMTKKTIQASCRKNKLYLTPHLNEVLYLHYSGYNEIDCLEEYVGLKCLWLECNAISSISGLKHQPLLRCLYLHNNLIKKIENLEHCKQLDTLNLSHNHITKVENCGIDILPVLNTLNLSHNYLKSIESVEDLRKCDFVSVLDISHNRIEDIAIVKVLGAMKGLRVLTLTGNPVVNEIPSYRKTLILECKTLTYLDSRPVFDKDRACAEAWKRGGYQEELKEHQRWKKEEQRKMRRNINATLRLRHRGDGEPELLKTSSDEEADVEKNESSNTKEELQDMQELSNLEAWQETEALSNQLPDGQTSPSPSTSYGQRSGVDVKDKPSLEQSQQNTAVNNKDNMKRSLVEEISNEEYHLLTARKDSNEKHQNDSTATINEMTLEKKALEAVANKPDKEELSGASENMVKTFGDDIREGENCPINEIESLKEENPGTPLARKESEADLKTEDQLVVTTQESLNTLQIENEKESKIASAEKEETLNVVIHSKEISITMQPSCSDGKEIPRTSKDDEVCERERKPSVASVDYVTGSDSNSDPTLVTDCDSCIRNSSVAYSSRSDTSDSEDMFDKIVPRKHRKLASLVRTDPSSTGSSSESDDETGALGSKLDRQNTITEFIDEYKRFFRSVDTRDPKCVVKNRHKLVRPQTAKSQRTEPLIYDGVLKSMERQSNASKIEQVRQERAEACASMAKESVFERLLKGHAAVDMDIESPTISIGGKPHNLNEYRLDVFREGPAKLQTLIDRVTAHKDRYNAQIDSIHVQLANIMDDYGQISEKLKRVDNMIQTIEEEVDRDDEDEFNDALDKIPQQSTTERIVEAVAVGTGNDQPMSSGESSGASFDPALFEHDEQGDENEPGSRIEIEEGIFVAAPQRKSIPDEFHGDPVYRKFIDIQHEIDKLTADEIFHVLSEAARELHGDDEQETRLLHDAVDEYWARYDDVEAFRRCLNLNAHPIIQRFKRFIECQCETDTDSEDREHVRKLEQAYQRYERRLSNHLFDEYLIMSRKVSIATTTGGESSAAELEIIEIEPDAGEVAGVSGVRRSNAWDFKEPGETPAATEESPVLMKSDADKTAPKIDELEDEESKPEQEDLFNEDSQRTQVKVEKEISS